MTAARESRGVQVEARTLSGVHLGQRVVFDDLGGDCKLKSVMHSAEVTHITVDWRSGVFTGGDSIGLNPTDLVTLTGGDAS